MADIIQMMKTFTVFLGLFLSMTAMASSTHYDTSSGDIAQFFNAGKGKYIIRYVHSFTDTLYIPQDSEVRFKGGRLSGPIVFNNTKLSGRVDLKGSHIAGSVSNKMLNASWLCAMDGVSDDAPVINDMIVVSGEVFFPRGTYRLVSPYPDPDGYYSKTGAPINFHIGIHRDNVRLMGEKGTVFLTQEQLGIICVYSKPYDIPGSVRNIRLKGITFRTMNDGSTFLEWTHAIKTKGVNGFSIENCRIEDFWGDGICLDHYGDTPQTGERTRNQNVRIVNNTIVGGRLHNNRNGISVINGKNVLIKNNVIRETSRKDMPGAIDVEPNNSAYTIDNIRIVGNIIKGSRGACGAIELCSFNGGPARHVFVEKNRISDSNLGIYVYLKTTDTTEHFVIRNNRIDADTPPCKFVGDGHSKDWIISGNSFKHPTNERIPGELRIENLRVK